MPYGRMIRWILRCCRGGGDTLHCAATSGWHVHTGGRHIGGDSARRGSALVIALWVLLLLGLLVGSFAFDMQVEAAITSHYRKRAKADQLARAGVEWAKLVLSLREDADPTASEDMDEDAVYLSAIRLQRGAGITGLEVPLGDGKFRIGIVPEESRRNVNRLTREEWEQMLELGLVPVEQWDELIDCFQDWIDSNSEHGLNGAEADDPFYEDRGYEPKNAPVDTVDELLLIKGFDERILYGGPSDEEDGEPMPGIARWLTTWGDGRINANNASAEVLFTIPGIAEWEVDAIIQGRAGSDGIEGTRDDGYESTAQLQGLTGVTPSIARRLSVRDLRYLNIRSIGEVGGLRSEIQCTMLVDNNRYTPVAWREEPAR